MGAVGGKIDYIDSDLLRYTNPDAAADFVRQTNVTSLAIAIGTAHGIYKDMPKLDYGTLDLIRSKVEVPLVLHGASGLSDEQLCTCVHKGICKVNIATELRQAYTTAIREYLDNDEKVYDPKKYSLVAMKAVSEVVAQKIQVLGSDGKCR